MLSYNPKLQKQLGLGSSAFARRYLRNAYWSLFLQVLRCFTSLGAPPLPFKVEDDRSLFGRVPPFGNPRIKACLAAPRGLSQPCHVLHRCVESRHPPYALAEFPIRNSANRNSVCLLCFKYKAKRRTKDLLDLFVVACYLLVNERSLRFEKAASFWKRL